MAKVRYVREYISRSELADLLGLDSTDGIRKVEVMWDNLWSSWSIYAEVEDGQEE